METNVYSLKLREELRELLGVLRTAIQELHLRRPPGFENRSRLFETDMLIIVLFDSARAKVHAGRRLEDVPHEVSTALYHRALCEWRCNPEKVRTAEHAFSSVAVWVDAFQDLHVSFAGLRQELKARLNDRVSLESRTSSGKTGSSEAQVPARELNCAIGSNDSLEPFGGRGEGGLGLTGSNRDRSKRKIQNRDASLRIIRFLQREGYLMKDLAKRFNISARTISDSIHEERFSRELLDHFALLMRIPFDDLTKPEPEEIA